MFTLRNLLIDVVSSCAVIAFSTLCNQISHLDEILNMKEQDNFILTSIRLFTYIGVWFGLFNLALALIEGVRYLEKCKDFTYIDYLSSHKDNIDDDVDDEDYDDDFENEDEHIQDPEDTNTGSEDDEDDNITIGTASIDEDIDTEPEEEFDGEEEKNEEESIQTTNQSSAE